MNFSKTSFALVLLSLMASTAYAQEAGNEQLSEEERILLEVIRETEQNNPVVNESWNTGDEPALTKSMNVNDMPTVKEGEDAVNTAPKPQGKTFNINELKTHKMHQQAMPKLEAKTSEEEEKALDEAMMEDDAHEPVNNLIPEKQFDFGAPATADIIPHASEEGLSKYFVPDIRYVENHGSITAAQSGFEENVWDGIDRAHAVTSIKRIQKNGLKSAAMRHVLERLLMAQAVAPKGESSHNWLTIRVNTLESMGMMDSAYSLLNEFSGKSLVGMDNLDKKWTEMSILTGNLDACEFVKSRAVASSDYFWKHALITCQATEGDANGLSLTLQVTDNETKASDVHLYKLIDAIRTGAEAPYYDESTVLNNLHFALYGIYPNLVTENVIPKLPDVTLRNVANNPAVENYLRLQAAERLVSHYGDVDDIISLGKIYEEISFDKLQLSKPLDAAKEITDGGIARALLWQAAGSNELASAKSLMLKSLWERAEDDNMPELASKLTPDMRSISPNKNIAWFAPYVIRTNLMGGNIDVAKKWWEILSSNSRLSADLKRERSDLTLAFAIVNNNLDRTVINNWWEGLDLSKDSTKIYAQRMLSMLEAADLEVPVKIWQEMYAKFNDTTINHGNGPGPMWLRILGTSLQENKVGESLLVLTEPLQTIAPQNMDPQGVANIVIGLKYLGFSNDAAMVALEAVLNSNVN